MSILYNHLHPVIDKRLTLSMNTTTGTHNLIFYLCQAWCFRVSFIRIFQAADKIEKPAFHTRNLSE